MNPIRFVCRHPDHCIVGSVGHGVVPVIDEALQEWVEATGKPVFYVMKGMNNRTEMFSALEAEVEDPEDADTSINEVSNYLHRNLCCRS